MAMVDRIEKLSKIDVHDIAASQVHRLFPQRGKCPVGARPGRNPCEASRKSASYTGSSTIRTVRWRILSSNVGIPSGRVSSGEPALGMCTRRTGGATYVPDLARSRRRCRLPSQIGLVFVRGLSVHADSPVLASLDISLVQPVDVDVMRQVREGQIRAVLRELRDSSSFCIHGVRSRRTCHVSLRRFMKRRPLPSPGSIRDSSPGSTVLRDAPTPCRPFRRTSFPSLGDTSAASVVRPPRFRTRNRGSSWSCLAVAPAALLAGDGRVSQVPRGSLVIIRPALRPRRDQAG